MKYAPIFAFVILCMLIPLSVMAIPTTLPATNIGSNNFTLNCAGATGEMYYKWGLTPNSMNVWTSPTTSTSSDEYGSPISPGRTYYATACDSTGCDATPVSFTTTAATLASTTPALDTSVNNMTKNRFNLLMMPDNIVRQYTQWAPDDSTKQIAFTIITGIIMFALFAGMWLRTRGVSTSVVLGFLVGGFILTASGGLNLGIPVEFQSIGQGIMYASLAGIALSLLKK